MREFDAGTLAALQDRSGIITRQMIWITAKNRIAGDPETIGLWNGPDHETVTIGGETRTYYGAGTNLKVPRIITEVGIQARTHRVTLSALAPEVLTAIRTWDARLAPVEIHRVLLDLSSHNLVSEPHRVFRGWINKAPLPRRPEGEEAELTLSLTSSARALTRTVSLLKSDESQKLRGGDRFRRHADVSGDIITYWGEAKL